MAYELTMEQGLSQQLNQFQIQSLQILSMDSYELEQFLQNEYIENPMLEYESVKESPRMLSGNAGGYQEVSEVEIKDETPEDKKEVFISQLPLSKFSKEQMDLIEYMIDCLDDAGLLQDSLEEISDTRKVSLDEVKACHDILVTLDPAGVFARSLEECLVLQLERLGQLDELVERVIYEHLSDLATGHISSITRDLGIPTIQVRKYMQQIQQLNPRPLNGYTKERAKYIVPDLILSKAEEEWKLEFNDNWIGNYSLSDYYLKMMKNVTDKELKQYFQKKFERSRFIIASIEQRRETIQKIAWAVFEQQKDYFIKNGKLKPMSMQKIAEDTKMHVSTVSRAAKGKYIQFPYGTVSFKELFTSSYSFGEQGSTALDIKVMIQRMIQSEDKSKPYSDNQLSQLLLEKDMKISRRTVAKYREELGIPGTYTRKK